MRTRAFAPLSLVLVLSIVSSSVAWAAGPPTATVVPPSPGTHRAPSVPDEPGGAWRELPPVGDAHGQTAQAISGPDDFGYTWDDSAAFNWVDATGGTKLQFTNRASGPVDIGFPFRFYENPYSRLWVSQDGLLSFNAWPYCRYGDMPSPASPNNDVAPYMTTLELSGAGSTPASGVYYVRGGQAPVRYVAVQWQDVVSQVRDPSDYDTFTFQAVLYESGDILLQYRDMRFSGTWYSCGTLGMEDAVGLDGLQYGAGTCVPANVRAGNAAMLIRRPSASARVQVTPPYDGSFTYPGGTVSYPVVVRNTGELGADVYDLSLTSAWGAALYGADGSTPLADSDGDGVVDTGLVLQGASTTITVSVRAPAAATVGQNSASTLQVTSSLGGGKSGTAALRTAIPAAFAQAYRDTSDSDASLYLAVQSGQIRSVVPSGAPRETAISQVPGGFAYVWTEGRWKGHLWVSDLWFALLDWHGEVQRGPAKLTNNAGAVLETNDGAPAVAALPDGRVGVLWQHTLYDGARSNSNIHFAVLSPTGTVVVPPTDLTGNREWLPASTPPYGVPRFYAPAIAPAGGGRFALAWNRYHQEAPGGSCSDWCSVSDVYYAVRGADGAQIKGVTRFTQDEAGGSGQNSGPSLAGLLGNRLLLTWYRDGDIYFAGLDSAGGVVQAATALTSDEWQYHDSSPQAQELPDGTIIIAWVGGNAAPYSVRFAMFDGSLYRLLGPVTLDNPGAVTGDSAISIAADEAGHAILTWMGGYRHLYYALVDSGGTVLTPPMIFRTAARSDGDLESSYYGCGNASYPWWPAADADGAAWFAAALSAGSPGSSARLLLRYGNYGQASLTGAVLTLELAEGLSYISDTSGLTPTTESLAAGPGLSSAAAGARVSWSLPSMALFARSEFAVSVGLPAAASIGTRYRVSLGLTSSTEANPADNQASGEAMAAAVQYLPKVSY